MQPRLSNFIVACSVTLFLFLGSCTKSEFSKDNPLPEVFTNSVIIGSQNGIVYAFDTETSRKKWEFNAKSNVQGSPLVLDGFIYIAAESGSVYKISAKYGTLIKTFVLPGQILATPLGEYKGKNGNNYIYIGCGNNRMYAYDVTADTLEWSYNTGGKILSSATLYDTLVFFGSYDNKVYALDKEDGAKVWEYTTGGPIYSSPTVVGNYPGGFVYVGSYDGKMYCLRVNNGTLRWQYNTGGPILSSPISYGGNAIFGSNDYKLYCIDTATAKARWIITTKDRIVSSPYAHNQLIYVGSYDYKVYAVNIIDGTIRWEFLTKAIVKSSPMVYDNKLYVGSHDKTLYCLEPENGFPIWTQNVNGLIECSPVVDNLNKNTYQTSSISGNSPH